MNKINRSVFLQQSLKAGAFITLATLANWEAVAVPQKKHHYRLPQTLMQQMIAANDKAVAALLKANVTEQRFSRNVGRDFAKLAAAYATPDSKYFHSAEVTTTLQRTVSFLLQNQTADGTVNVGNLESPPDTAFLLESLTAGAFILKKDGSDNLTEVNTNIKNFLLKAGEALVTGGVHTPNHRWVICGGLARLNALYPNKRYITRINEWLGEGIFNDADGHYPERSMNYAYVEDNSMITMARLLNMPNLLAPVRRNLDLVYYCADPNGDLTTNESRRQDQYSKKNIVEFYLHYRYMAIHDTSAKWAGITNFIEGLNGFEEGVIAEGLYHFLEDSLLQKDLPIATPPPVNFEKLFTTSSLLRIRRTNTTITLYGGTDLPIEVASGRSNTPNIFAYRKGKAVLDYLRLSTSFFSTGYFYSDGVRKEGSSYQLSRKLEAPYYQPLPKNLRNAKGDYKLSSSIDGRFWNKMDFKNRPVSNVKTLQTAVTLQENNAHCELQFAVTGLPGVEVTIELHFPKGGKLTGVQDAGNDNYFLENGSGQYTNDGDTITFEGGIKQHQKITGLEGERYSTHFGTLRTEGLHVYLTGITPFQHTLRFS